MAKASHIYHVYIRTTPEKLWRALTDPEMTSQFFHGTRFVGEFTSGSPYVCYLRDGRVAVEGTVLEADPPRRLAMSWQFQYDPELAAQERSRVIWEIERKGDVCLLTVTHNELDPLTSDHVSRIGGWPFVLSNLKSLLETGKALAENFDTLGA